jgi:hypothetical protein
MSKPIYYVIDSDGMNFTPAMRPAGPFSSLATAEDHLVTDALTALYSDSCDPVRPDDCATWAAPAHIVKVVKTVRQVPVYDVRVKLVKIKTETLKTLNH